LPQADNRARAVRVHAAILRPGVPVRFEIEEWAERIKLPSVEKRTKPSAAPTLEAVVDSSLAFE
jgi:hypothetical protein